MNQLDALLLVLLVPFALRGWWRGFCRESLALVGLLGGALAATAAGPHVARLLVARHVFGPLVAMPVAYTGVLLVVWSGATLLGYVADRIVRALLLGGVNRIAGAVFGFAKGAAVLGFALLLMERFLPSPAITHVIAASRLGRPLELLASGVVQAGRELGGAPDEHRA